MTKTIALPTLDRTGRLSSLVLEAVASGAVAALDPSDPHNTMTLAFSKTAEAKAFEAKVALLSLSDALTDAGQKAGDAFDALAETLEESDPVEDQPKASE